MSEAYIRAISIVAENPDWKAIALKLAQHDPELFCKLVDDFATVPSWFPYKLTEPEIVTIKDTYRSGGKVPAIRVLREMSGAGLKEAKELIEAIM